MPRRELNNHNTAKKNGYFLGHSWTSEATKSITDNLITLSQALAYQRGNNTFYFTRGSPASIYGFFWYKPREVGLFFCPRRTTAAGTVTGAK